MRFQGFRPFAIVALFALMLGGQLCMIVDCAPRALAASSTAHACCAATAATTSHAPAHAPRPAARDCERPCCIAVALSSAPVLERPAARDAHDALACLSVADALAGAPVPVRARVRPDDPPTRPDAAPRSAAGTRAPPIA